jgi:proline dehydrogenase
MIKPLTSHLMRTLLTQVAKRYVVGPAVEDALPVIRRYAANNIGCTLGYWDKPGEDPALVLEQYQQSIKALTGSDYLSIKMTALGFSEEMLDQLAVTAMQKGIRIHFDAMTIDTTDRTRESIEGLVLRHGQRLQVGYTIAARWRRSVDDAAWACELGLPIRIVRGQFPEADDADPASGYLAVTRALAGKARYVAVATHNPDLCEHALNILLSAGTPIGLEQLHGLPMRRQLRMANKLQLQTTVYVAYGHAFLPYVVSSVMRDPKTMLWLMRDLMPV